MIIIRVINTHNELPMASKIKIDIKLLTQKKTQGRIYDSFTPFFCRCRPVVQPYNDPESQDVH